MAPQASTLPHPSICRSRNSDAHAQREARAHRGALRGCHAAPHTETGRRGCASACVDDGAGRAPSNASSKATWAKKCVPARLLVAPQGYRFMDSRSGFLSIINRASVRDHREAREPQEHRSPALPRQPAGEGLEPWAEFDLVGQRCASARRNWKSPSALTAAPQRTSIRGAGIRDLRMSRYWSRTSPTMIAASMPASCGPHHPAGRYADRALKRKRAGAALESVTSGPIRLGVAITGQRAFGATAPATTATAVAERPAIIALTTFRAPSTSPSGPAVRAGMVEKLANRAARPCPRPQPARDAAAGSVHCRGNDCDRGRDHDDHRDDHRAGDPRAAGVVENHLPCAAGSGLRRPRPSQLLARAVFATLALATGRSRCHSAVASIAARGR